MKIIIEGKKYSANIFFLEKDIENEAALLRCLARIKWAIKKNK